MATIIAGFLVILSVVMTLIIARSKKDGKLLSYDMEVLNEKDAREFSNLIANLLSNVTFFYGVILYVLDMYVDYGLYIGIGLLILTVIQDIYFIRVLFPKEYKKIRGAKTWK